MKIHLFIFPNPTILIPVMLLYEDFMKIHLFIFPNLHKINIFDIYTIIHKYI